MAYGLSAIYFCIACFFKLLCLDRYNILTAVVRFLLTLNTGELDRAIGQRIICTTEGKLPAA